MFDKTKSVSNRPLSIRFLDSSDSLFSFSFKLFYLQIRINKLKELTFARPTRHLAINLDLLL